MRQLRASKAFPLFICAVTVVLGAACQEWLDPADRYSGSLTSGTPRGALRLLLTDAPLDEVERVDVTIDRVDVTFADGAQAPQTILDEPKTFNLLDLRGGFTAVLAEAVLPIGTIQQIRLIVASEGNSVTVDGEVFDLRIPSGEQTGIKLTRPGGFVISEDTTTEVVIDFDAERSLHHNLGQGWLLRPVVNLVDGVVLSVTSPRPGAFVTSRQVAVAGTVAAPAGVASVTANGVACSVDAGAFTCAIVLDEGAQQIEVVATDAGGVQARVTIAVTVDTYPPHVEIVSPYEGRVVIGTLGLQAAARDASGIAGVTLYLDGQAVATVSLEPYLRWLESGDYVNGEHVFHAVAVDRAGHSAASQQVRATFDNIQGFGIASVEPLQGAVGTFVTIRGAGFEPPVQVFFGEIEAEVVEATGSVAMVRVPTIAARSPVGVVNGSGQSATHIVAFTPLSAALLAGLSVESFDPELQPPIIIVKLREGLQVRARGGTWVSDGVDDVAGLLARLGGLGVTAIRPRLGWTDATAASIHDKAESWRALDEADPRLVHEVVVDVAHDPSMVFEALEAEPAFERLSFAVQYTGAGGNFFPNTWDLQAGQCYRRDTDDQSQCDPPNSGEFDPDPFDNIGGHGFESLGVMPGGRGQGVRLAQIEFNWEADHVVPSVIDHHEDLSAISPFRFPERWVGTPAANLERALVRLGALTIGVELPETFSRENFLRDFARQHGTAVAGILWADDDDWGVTGVATGSTPLLVTLWPEERMFETFGFGIDADQGLQAAIDATRPGDIILIENAIFRPALSLDACPDCLEWPAMLPVETLWFVAATIRWAVGSDRVVVELAGNGHMGRPFASDTQGPGLNLDRTVVGTDPILRYLNVTRETDTGAIVVGASQTADGARTYFSNHGSRIDINALGENVVTTGYCSYDWVFAEGDGELQRADRSRESCFNAPFRPLDTYQGYTSRFGGTSSASALVAGGAAALQGYYKELVGDTTAYLTPNNLRTMMVLAGQWHHEEGRIGPFMDLVQTATLIEWQVNRPLLDPIPNMLPDNISGVNDIVVADFVDTPLYGYGNEIFLARGEGGGTLYDDVMLVSGCLTSRFCERPVNGPLLADMNPSAGGAAAALDINGDGLLDVYSATADDVGWDVAYLNKTFAVMSPRFEALDIPTNMPRFTASALDVATGDVNADCKTDVLVTAIAYEQPATHLVINESASDAALLRDGSAHLPYLPASRHQAGLIVLLVGPARCGQADIFIAGLKQNPPPANGNPDVLLVNRGASCFDDHEARCFDLDSGHIVAPAHQSSAATSVDIDGDGLIDVAVGTSIGPPVLYRSLGNHHLVDQAPQWMTPDALSALTDSLIADVVAADLTFDGRPELIYATAGGLVLLVFDPAIGRYRQASAEELRPEAVAIVARTLAVYPRDDGGSDIIAASPDTGVYYLVGRPR